MPLLTPSKKVPLEGHFGGRLKHNRRGPTPISRPIARCCTIAAMGRHKNSDLQALRRWLGTLVIAGLPSVASAGYGRSAGYRAAIGRRLCRRSDRAGGGRDRAAPTQPCICTAPAGPHAPRRARRTQPQAASPNCKPPLTAASASWLSARASSPDGCASSITPDASSIASRIRCRTICARRCGSSTASRRSCWKTTATAASRSTIWDATICAASLPPASG